MTIVDRETSCFLSIQADWQRSEEVGQQMVNRAPAQQYYSNQYPLIVLYIARDTIYLCQTRVKRILLKEIMLSCATT